jgi:hypothetical protein
LLLADGNGAHGAVFATQHPQRYFGKRRDSTHSLPGNNSISALFM